MKRRLFPIFLMVAFLISNLFLKSAAAAQTKVNITGLNQEYVQGSSPTLYLTTTGVKGNVRYNVLLVDLVSGKKIDLTKGYSKPIKSNIKYSVKLPKLDNGYYRVFAYVKGEKSKTKYDGYAYKQFMVFVKDMNISKTGNYGSNNEKYFQTVKGNINITGNNVIYNNAVVFKDVFVKGDNVTLNNVKIEGKLVLDPGKYGKAYLNNISAKEIEVLSGASESIYLNNVFADELKVESENKVRIVTDQKTNLNKVFIQSALIFENKDANIGNVEVNTIDDNIVEFRGNFDTEVKVTSSAYIKTSENSLIKEIKLVPENSKSNIILEANIKNLTISKDSALEIKKNSNIEDAIKVEANATIKADKEAKINKIEITGANKNVKIEAKVDTLEIKAESKIELVNVEVKTLVASSKGEVLTNKETKIEKIEGSKKDEVKVSGEGQLASKDKDSKEDNQSSGGTTGGSTGGTTGGPSGGSTGGTTGGTPVIIPVSSIDFDEIGVVLNKNDELNLNCIVHPLTATDKRITWDSDNIDVISVSNGKVNAKAVGEATITAKTLDQKVKKSLKIKVVDSGISLIVKKESGKISFLVKSAYDNDIITMKVLQDGNIKYIDQIQTGKNYSKVSTMLDKGKYIVYVKGLNSDIISIEFEY